ncbi:MAG: c-type cytochrome [Candidatus Marinimicrobia bacterium]|nr:c-type cytochrome [Candidatus Neomarinimicrobiota bacterium]
MAKPKDDTEFLYNVPRLHMVFALASVLLLATVFLMVADDYIKEWREYQREFRAMNIDRSEQELEAMRAEIDSTQLMDVKERIAKSKTIIAEQEEKVEAANDQYLSLDKKHYRIDQDFRFAKSEFDAVKYSYEVQLEEDLTESAAESKLLMDTHSSMMEVASVQLELISIEMEKAQGAIDSLASELKAGENELKDLTKDIQKMESYLAQIGPSFANDYFRNLPMLDFISPTEKVIQVVIPDLHEDLNFLTVPRVDRCQTCHLAIEKSGFEEEEQPYRTHPNLETYLNKDSPHPLSDFGCTTCHNGLGRSVTFRDTYHTPKNNEQKEEWIEKYGWKEPHHWDYPMYRADLIEASCLKCHNTQAEVVSADILNAGVDLIKRNGCFGCHKIDGFNDLRKVGPDLSKLSSKVTKEWAYKWVNNPKHFQSKTKMPRLFGLMNSSTPKDIISNEVQVRAIVDYIFAKSESENYSNLPRRGNARRGKELVETLGCFGCHKLDGSYEEDAGELVSRREFGPNLFGLSSKVNQKWLYHWLKNPEQYFPETVMPRMRLSDREASDITSYLLSMNNNDFDMLPLPNTDNEVLDELTYDYLKRNMSRAEADAKLSGMNGIEKNEFLGEKLIGRYGCFGCHIIPGFEKAQQIGTELTEEGSKLLSRFDFGLVQIEHSKESWIFNKLKTPRLFDEGKVKTFDEKLRMPNFSFSDEEANAVLTVIMGLTKEKIASTKMRNLDSHELKVHEGLKLIQERNCRGCHEIQNVGGDIRHPLNAVMVNRGYTEEEAVVFSPPVLNGEGEKVQPDWLFRFVKDPKVIRPWLSVRMPTFSLSDKEALVIEQFFTHASKQEFPYRYKENGKLRGKALRDAQLLVSADYFSCFSCHQQGDQKPEGPITDWAPDLALAKERLRPEWIPKWIRNPNLIQPGTKMPTFFDPEYYDESGPDDILDGDEDKQIELMTNYILQLGG